MKKLLSFIAILTMVITPSLQAKLLDKIVAVVDDKVITLSMIKRIKSNLEVRRNMAPFIYDIKSPSQKQIADIIIHAKMIREKLAEFGYVINDERVEANIKQRQSAFGLNRKQLIEFLNGNNISFDEYFELTREAMEYSFFVDQVITPLISITDQEIKNTFYKNNLKNKTLAFKYVLVDFAIDKSLVTKQMKKNFKRVMKNFQTTGNLPSNFKSIETNNLGEITEDGLNAELKNLLKRTNEGDFSKPYLLGEQYHVFFIKKKDLVESELFTNAKNRIKKQLIQKSTKKMTETWFDRQKTKHYIKFF